MRLLYVIALQVHRPRSQLLMVCVIAILLSAWLAPATVTASGARETPPLAPTAPHELGWARGFDLPGVDNWIKASVVGPDGSLYAGGYFTIAGEITANHIGRWDGSHWHALDTGMSGGSYPNVYALAVGLDGSLYAGGIFATAGSVAANNRCV